MIFLKKIIINGFKSFATKTIIDFKHNMSGVVGPNGSGKSNIIDAIKWVLGEKSNKALRSKIGEDVIFHGSKEHNPAKMAEITLEFDNSNRALHYDNDTVSITRKLKKGEGINEYFINEEPCRLKDIQDIFLDTGLSKGSLGIISQGTVQWFVDAKPEERRTIFEDAAGIGLYTKKREDATKELEKTQENLNRIVDINNELDSTLRKIKKQAEKAKIYEEKTKTLKELDLTIMVKDLKYFTERLGIIQNDVITAKDKLQQFEPSLKELNQSISFEREKQDTADRNVERLSNELTKLVEEINKLEIRKSSLHSQFQLDLGSDNLDKKIEAFQNLISSTKFTIDDAKNNIQKLQDNITTYGEIITNLTQKRNQLNTQTNEQSNKLIETRTKIKQLVEMLDSNANVESGVKAIIENKLALTGICGIVKDFINVEQDYQTAIVTALGKHMQNIIVEKNIDAEHAVDFLKANRAGKATFLPLDTIRAKGLRPEHEEILQNREGYCGIACDLIKYDSQYDSAIRFLLGNIIIADNLNNAFNLSKLTYQLYKVITLDGELISPGGSITGGYINKNNLLNQLDSKKTLDELNKSYPLINDKFLELRNELEKTIADLNEISSKQSEKKILLSRYEEILRTNENLLLKYESDYQQLAKTNGIEQKEKSKWDENTIDVELAKLINKKNKVYEDLNVNRNSKAIYKSQLLDTEAKLNQVRFQVDESRDVVAKHQAEKVKCESIIENARNKINQTYHMTVEFAMENYVNELPMSDQQARDAIAKLQGEITRLGPINMEALNDLQSLQARYDEMSKQQKEIETAKEHIEEVIRNLDIKVRKDFDDTINKVNETLPEVFKYLLGGGTCHVEYTDPENILTSGIEVIVAPYGKNITRLSLLSGGEKSLVALSILFSILKIKNFPLVILDEAESALDPANVERFANMIQLASDSTQFLVITHRPGTMEKCDILFGATMQQKGVTSIYQVELSQAQNEFGSDETGESN